MNPDMIVYKVCIFRDPACTDLVAEEVYMPSLEDKAAGRDTAKLNADARIAQLQAIGRATSLEPTTWGALPASLQCRTLLRVGYAYMCQQALRQAWPALANGLTQDETYQGYVQRLDHCALAQDVAGIETTFKQLWAYCGRGV